MEQMINDIDIYSNDTDIYVDDTTNKITYVQAKNTGKFMAKLSVNFDYNGNNFVVNSSIINSGKTEKVYICPMGTNFNVSVEIYNGMEWKEIFQQKFQKISVLQLLLTGTADSPKCTITEGDTGDEDEKPLLYAIKVPDPTVIMVGSIATITVSISNIGTSTAMDVYCMMNIAEISEFIPESLVVNGKQVQSPIPPTKGIYVGNIKPEETSVINYKILIKDMPSANPVIEKPTILYTTQGQNGETDTKTITGEAVGATIIPNSGQPCSCCGCCQCNNMCCHQMDNGVCYHPMNDNMCCHQMDNGVCCHPMNDNMCCHQMDNGVCCHPMNDNMCCHQMDNGVCYHPMNDNMCCHQMDNGVCCHPMNDNMCCHQMDNGVCYHPMNDNMYYNQMDNDPYYQENNSYCY